MRTLFLTSLILLFCSTGTLSFAQNVNRAEEEKELDRLRQERVEEIVREREADAKKIKENPELYKKPEDQMLVEVEPVNVLPADLSSVSALVPYKVRRNETGFEVGFKYTLFEPSNFASSFGSGTIVSSQDLYGSAPLYEVYLNYKRNLSFGSIGAELGYGMYKNDVDDTSFGDKINLNLQIVSLGGKFIFDAIQYEPYIAPYVSGGLYTAIYKEENGDTGDSDNGNTQVAPYFAAGVLFQLNWIDKAASVEAYSEGGIENTFVYLEVKKFMASNNDSDPDFSTDPVFGGGLSLEF